MPTPIQRCRICGNSNLIKVLDLGEQALTGVFPRSKDQPVTRGPLQLLKCHDEAGADVCGLLQLAHSYDLNEMYGDNYGYRSGLNPSMVRHLQGKVGRILGMASLSQGDLIVDIGSNDSTTLQAYPPGRYRLAGIDPTGVKFKQYYPPHIELIPDFFSLEKFRAHFGEQKAKVVTSFSMFYDLEAPMDFMREVRDILHAEGIWVFEQSYMPAMLERNAYDTVCHEHLEYYGLKQIKWMADKVGLRIVDVEFNDINGGSFSVTAARADSAYPVYSGLDELLGREWRLGLTTLAPYLAFAERVEKARIALLEFIRKAKSEKKRVVALGASTKGNVVLQYCGITPDLLESVGEINPDKFGKFTPGTHVPILPEDGVLNGNPDFFIVLPWHFRTFFEQQQKYAGRSLVFPLPNLEILTLAPS
jgi:NDP-4-keto-2,6-dideoxyhexose 3-C-methyltransferase